MENLTYESAFKELEEITREIENEAVSVDVLSEKVKRASFLIEYCQKKLRQTEDEVGNIIRQMEGDSK
ncbi:exodeoxyribonuclease VII small subunit [Pedobacter sp. SAFR-022]|uniref:exodeoxyribonuclease VII small subunit n=1 Tax=Pedobacter sp. SAFR-022 TaxID=3436861 RepID=UPI003F7EC19F